ncbi:MAG: hypothetical protein ACI841_003829 [Planctomycetota bacterium]|jgi:hypothetical protein
MFLSIALLSLAGSSLPNTVALLPHVAAKAKAGVAALAPQQQAGETAPVQPRNPLAGLGPNEVPVTALVVGDQLVSYSVLEQTLQREMALGRVKGGTNQDLLRHFQRIGNQTMVRYVKVQAGKDFGFADEMIDSLVRRHLDFEVERRGGAVDASADFERFGLQAGEYQDFTRERVYLEQWERAASGKGVSGTGRISVDDYVRPGVIWSAYRSHVESLDPRQQARIGKYDQRVLMQQLVLDVEAHGGLEPTMQLAESLISALEAGEDFTELVKMPYSVSKTNDGILAPQSLETYRVYSNVRFQSPVLSEFAINGKVGDLMKPSLGQFEDERSGVFIFKIIKRLDATDATGFTDRDLQLRLKKEAQKAIDDAHLMDAIREREKSIFVWPRDTWSSSKQAQEAEEIENQLYQEIDG